MTVRIRYLVANVRAMSWLLSPISPTKTSALLGWPEFGYGMRTVAAGYADLVPWRGDRDSRDWPERVKHDSEGIRWKPIEATPIEREWA
jgi:hypothetical protein